MGGFFWRWIIDNLTKLIDGMEGRDRGTDCEGKQKLSKGEKKWDVGKEMGWTTTARLTDWVCFHVRISFCVFGWLVHRWLLLLSEWRGVVRMVYVFGETNGGREEGGGGLDRCV